MKKLFFTFVLMNFAFLLSCKKDESSTIDIEETAQQMGDIMASVDESGGSGGTLAYIDKTLDRFEPKTIFDYFIESSFAITCTASGGGFGVCSGNTVTRTFSSCSMGLATLNGTVTLNWSDLANDNTCQMTTAGHNITRNPNFTITGRRGATLTVSKSGTNGQKIEFVSAGNFYLSNDGIRRVFTTSTGSTLFDFTTTIADTSQGRVNISGTSRAGRILNGGQIVVTNNLSSEVCTYVPTNVTWPADGSCNCATSGSWSGSCTKDSSTTNSTLTLSSCGRGTFDKDGETQTVSFDRCTSI